MPLPPTITLQPGGPRQPTATQKANIRAALGAAAAAHAHSMADVTGLAAALAAGGGASAWSSLTDRTSAPLATENTGLANALAGKAPVAAPAFTGTAVFEGLTEGVANLGNSTGTRTLSIATATSLETTLTGNCSFTLPSATPGKSFVLDVLTGVGGFAPTFTGVTWAGGVTPVFPTTAGARITLGFRTNAAGTLWLGSMAGGRAPEAWSDITGKPAALTAYADAANAAARRALIGAGTSNMTDVIIRSATPPSDTSVIWFDTESATELIWYVDAWVETSSASGGESGNVIVALTWTAYGLLTAEQQNDPTKTYFIVD